MVNAVTSRCTSPSIVTEVNNDDEMDKKWRADFNAAYIDVARSRLWDDG